MKKDNLPVLGNAPRPPARFKPVDIPNPNLGQSTVGLFFGKKKIKQAAEIMKYKAEAMKSAYESNHYELETMMDLATFGPRLADYMDETEKNKRKRELVIENMQLMNENLQLLNENLQFQNDNLKVQTYKLQEEVKQAGWESNISELDYRVRLKQFDKMMKEVENE